MKMGLIGVLYNLSTGIETVSPENKIQLQYYLIWNAHLPEILVNILPMAFFSFGSCLNLMLFAYIVGSGRWKSPVFTVIGSLAIADTMVCVAAVLWASIVYPVIANRSLWWICHLSMFLGGGLNTGGYILIFFAALRFYQFKYPLAARARVTCSFVLKWMALIWFVFLSYGGVLWSIIYRAKEVLIDGNVALICEPMGNGNAVSITFLIINTIIPCASIAILHTAKHIVVARSHKDLNVQSERRNTDARAVSAVIILFFICWVPVNMYSVAIGTVSQDYYMFQDKLYLIFAWIMCCNSTFNPIIYCIAAKTVRDDFIRFLFCRGKRAHKQNA